LGLAAGSADDILRPCVREATRRADGAHHSASDQAPGSPAPRAGRHRIVAGDQIVLATAALDRAIRDLGEARFAWVVLTSPRTVDALAARLRPRQIRAQVAAIGEGTREAFRAWARRDPDLVPRTYTTAALPGLPHGHGRVRPRADVAPEGLEDALAAKGWSPTRVDAYRTRMPRSLPPAARMALRRGEVDAVTFTSASTVRGFVRALGPTRGNPRVVCIGPVTAREARDRGLTVHAVANPHTIEGLVAAVERSLARRGA
jgi:uroporphyrinogen-III synthase